MKMMDKGVLIIMSHLIITVLILIGYMLTAYHGHADDTLKYILFSVVGYWFGAIGLPKTTDKQNDNSKGGNANE